MTRPTDDDLRRNRQLALLPDGERERVAQAAAVTSLEVRDIIFRRDEPIGEVHFPLTGVLSMISEFDGHAVEVATVGREGMLGLPVFLQAAFTSAHMAFCQIPGESIRIPSGAFAGLLTGDGALHDVLHRYTQALFTQIAQNAACNAVHDAVARSARWILMTHDRVDGDEFVLTREFLGQMLGMDAAAVDAASGALEDDGAIVVAGDRVRVVDRDRLLDAACGCYAIIRGEQDRLLAGRA